MKDRIRKVRKESHKTQAEFAESLGLKQNTIATYEMGRFMPSDRTISDICRTYNVNEEWLRTGEGEMFVPRSREDEVAAYFGRIMGGKCSNIESAIISLMARATPEDWELVTTFARELAAALEAKEKPGQD